MARWSAIVSRVHAPYVVAEFRWFFNHSSTTSTSWSSISAHSSTLIMSGNSFINCARFSRQSSHRCNDIGYLSPLSPQVQVKPVDGVSRALGTSRTYLTADNLTVRGVVLVSSYRL